MAPRVRCVFFHIPFPSKAELKSILGDRFPGAPLLDHALDIFVTLRGVPNLTKRPTTSELINWVQAQKKDSLVSALGPADIEDAGFTDEPRQNTED